MRYVAHSLFSESMYGILNYPFKYAIKTSEEEAYWRGALELSKKLKLS